VGKGVGKDLYLPSGDGLHALCLNDNLFDQSYAGAGTTSAQLCFYLMRPAASLNPLFEKIISNRQQSVAQNCPNSAVSCFKHGQDSIGKGPRKKQGLKYP